MRATSTWTPRGGVLNAAFLGGLALLSFLFLRQVLPAHIAAAPFRDAAAAAPPPPPPPPAPSLSWTHIDDVIDVDWPARRAELVTGCPPPPALCRAHHVFDAVFVISLPRYAARATRVAAQLEAAGVNFTLVRGPDGRVGGWTTKKLAEIVMLWHSDKTAGPFCLLMTHLALFEAARARGLRNMLILEDDVTLSSDFARDFDAAARAAPADYISLQFCWLAEHAGIVPTPRGPRPQWVTTSRKVFQSCAVAVSAEGAAELSRSMVESRQVIDGQPYDDLFTRFPSKMYVAYPPLGSAPVFPDTGVSTLGHGWPSVVPEWRAINGVEAARFDLYGRGFVRGGERGTALACAREEAGVDFFGNELQAPATSQLKAATPAACCAACKDGWPYCRAWTHTANVGGGDGDCYLKTTDKGRRVMTGAVHAVYTSGFIEQVPA
jgi:hypothetical protein